MTKLIYGNPKRPAERSSPVGEDETTRIKILEAAGWEVVETLNVGVAQGAPVEEPAAKPSRRRKEAAVEAPVEEPAEEEAEPSTDEMIDELVTDGGTGAAA